MYHTNSIGIKRRLISSKGREVCGHTSGGGRSSVRVGCAVHGQGHPGREPLIVEELVLARADSLASDRVLEYGAAGVAAARGGGRGAGPRRCAGAACAPAHSRLRRRRTVGGCRYGAL